MVKLDYLKEYVLLAETRNFTRTAELSFITQPALSKHVSILEKEMGAKLFERTTRTVCLTPAGEAVYSAFRSMLNLYARAKHEAGELSRAVSGKLIIDSPYYWTGDYTEPLIAEFRKQFPACEINVRSCQPNDGMEDLALGKCDVLICMRLMNAPPTITGNVFAQEELCLFMLRDCELASRAAVQLEDIDGRPYIYLRGHEQDLQPVMDEIERAGIFPSELYGCEQVDMLGSVLLEKRGVTILPKGVIHMDRPYVVIKSFQEKMHTDMLIYYRKDTNNSMVQNFLETCTNVFESHQN